MVLGGMVISQLLPDAWQEGLRYDREQMAAGQAWRLLTACIVHLGWAHLALNGVGLLLMSWIFAADWPPYRWLLALGISGLVSTLGVHLGNPEVFWLVGLSGALHGLFAFGAIGWLRMRERVGWALLAGLAAKILYEQVIGSLAVSEAIVGGAVIEDAHLWGVLGGLLAAGIDRVCWRRGPAPL
jgi:rhomboid family GlyGly-CTERM serine protease